MNLAAVFSLQALAHTDTNSAEAKQMAGAIDIVVHAFTPAEVNHGQTGFDDALMSQVRMPESF